MFCASQLYVYLLRHLPRFPPKVVTVTEVTVFHESVSFPSLEEDNNIYKYIYILLSIIITYNLKVLQNPCTPSAENCNFCNRNHCNHLRQILLPDPAF